MHMFQESPIITDAKALFDSTLSVTPGMKLSERRTAIEICILKERLAAVWGNRWVNSNQKLADGLTKTSARDAFAYTLSRGVHALRYDQNFVAAKKVTQGEKDKENAEYERAAESLFEGQMLLAEDYEKKERLNLCRLPGCQKEKDRKIDSNHYCSRRHFYLHLHRRGQGGDEWRKAARCALAVLQAENLAGAEAMATEDSDQVFDYIFMNTIMVVLCFAVLGAAGSVWVLQNVIYRFANRTKNGIIVVREYFRALVFRSSIGLSHGDSLNAGTATDEARELEIDNNETESDDELLRGNERLNRWKRRYDEVHEEEGQSKWRDLCSRLWTNQVSAQMRGHVIWHCRADVRRDEYLKLTLASSCENLTDEQIRQWHRFLNAHFCLIIETHIEIRAKEQKLSHYKSMYDDMMQEKEEQDPHKRERKRVSEIRSWRTIRSNATNGSTL